MKLLALFVLLIAFSSGQEANPPKPAESAPKAEAKAEAKPDPEQAELNRALSDAGPSGIDFIRALENHLKKYPDSKQKVAIERAIVKAAIDSKDDKRLIEYGERVLKIEPIDLQVLDKVTRALLNNDDRESANKSLGYAIRYQLEIESIMKLPAPGRYSEAQWKEELNKGLARALVYQARANGNQGKYPDAIELAKKSWDTYPTAGAARELGRWLSKTGKNMPAVEAIADAFTIEDPASTEVDRGKDRIRMGELYQKANGSETGLGDLILKSYDRTSAIMSDRMAKLKAADPNLQASKVSEFTLAGVAGDKLPISSLHGKTVVLDFWATWCGPCREALPHLRDVAKKFQGQPLVVLSVSLDSDEDKWKDFIAKNGMTWPQYRDGGFTSPIAKLFGVTAIPHTFTIDADGVLQEEHIGDASIEGKLKKLLAQAQAAQAHAQQSPGPAAK
jgi:thiol-disulfide isomerase/thioredoxin